MSAFEWFEGLRAEGERIRRIEQDIAFLESSIAPHGQGFEPMGHGGSSTDPMVRMSMVSAQITKLRRGLPTIKRKHAAKVEHARHILYGRSGHGGLARAQVPRGGTRYALAVDLLHARYIDGESWSAIARRYNPDTPNLTMWCKRRAQLICKEIDRIGMDALVDT